VTLAVHGVLPDAPQRRRAFVLVHGAANSARVWTFWQQALAQAGWPSFALDLRGHGDSSACDLSGTGMSDYADDLQSLLGSISPAPVLMGWSMGGLVAMMAASTGQASACIGLAPSTPALARDSSAPLRTGEFGAEEYGITDVQSRQQTTMPDLDREECGVALTSLGRESRLARDERAAGVVVPSLPCPLFIATGSADMQWPQSRYDALHLTAHITEVPGASHWGLVLSRRAVALLLPRVLQWLHDQGPDAE